MKLTKKTNVKNNHVCEIKELQMQGERVTNPTSVKMYMTASGNQQNVEGS